MRFTATLIFSISTILLWLSFSPPKSGAETIDRIIAQVGDRIITLYDIETFAPGIVRSINAIPDQAERDKIWQQYYNDTLNLMIQNTIVEMSAVRMGQTVTEQQVDEILIRMQEQNSQFRAKVREIIDREGKITPELRMEAKNELLREKVQAILFPRIVVTEEDIINYIKDDSNVNFGQTEYNLEIVFLPDKYVYAAFQNALKKGTFEDAAAAVSHPVIKMGRLGLDELIPEIRDEIKNLSAGGVSKAVIDEEKRYAVLRVIDINKSTTIPDSLRNSVINTIQLSQIDTIFNNWIDRNKNSILVNRYDQ